MKSFPPFLSRRACSPLRRRGASSPGLCSPGLCSPGLRLAALALPALALLACWAATVAAQPAAPTEEEPKIPEPQDVTLETKDFALIRGTYFAGLNGKDSAAIILLHGYEGARSEYEPFAKFLQSRGHAVLTVDLRGHGESLRVKGVDRQAFFADKLRAADFGKMVTLDLEAAKKFLRDEHAKEKLNIELLTVVGSDLGALIAMNWAVHDWSWPQLPGRKQGQDVKALVLLSPERTFKGLTSATALAHPLFKGQTSTKLSVLLVAGGAEPAAVSETRRVFSALEKSLNDEKAPANDSMFMNTPDTKIQGVKLLDPRLKLTVPFDIVNFIEKRVADRKGDFPWVERK